MKALQNCGRPSLYDPQNGDAYNALGLALMDRKIDESIGLFQKAIELKPNFVEAEFNLALAYHRRYGTEREIVQLQRVLAISPRHLVARNTLTRRFEETGKFDEALKMALETIRIAPESAEARLFAGKGLLKNGDLVGAVEQLESAILADPSLIEAHHHLAVALRKLGRQDDAAKEFEKAETLAPAQPLQHCREYSDEPGEFETRERRHQRRDFDSTAGHCGETALGGCANYSRTASIDERRPSRGI